MGILKQLDILKRKFEIDVYLHKHYLILPTCIIGECQSSRKLRNVIRFVKPN